MKKDLLKLLDLSKEEIIEILDMADQMKYSQKHNIPHDYLRGKTLAMIFEKNSTRTRVSFEVGMYQLGGHALFLSGKESQIGRGEPVEDTARVLARYCDGIMIRTFAQSEVEELAKYASIPVVNGLTDFAHPCQVLADLMTVREKMTRLEGLKLAFVGDGNNMANSLIVGGLKCGMDVSAACPEGYDPDPAVLDFAKSVTGSKFELVRAPADAVKDADVVITDVWASMGQEEERAVRAKAFAGYCVDEAL
ncbi:MAG: ornithine carbamoyltransferase, partial [Oscillospiraceae bacterium]|nr:ornithine carbamoyltransferase [Oscillospiraceae bacterium]